MENGIKDKVERIREKAKIFLNKNIKAFIVDINDNFYFCDITLVSDDFIEVVGFAGRRKFERDKIFLIDILRFEEYEELEKNNSNVKGGDTR